jgi:hypothetical protein
MVGEKRVLRRESSVAKEASVAKGIECCEGSK